MTHHPEPPIGEDDLQALVDGRLDPARLPAVQRYLDARPDEAARVQAFIAQRDALRAALAFKHAEPIPPRLRIAHLRVARRQAALARWRVAAAAAVLLLAGSGLGWALRGAVQPEIAALPMPAPDRSAMPAPQDWPGPDTDLAAWLERRLGEALSPPDLEGFGFTLKAAQVLPDSLGPAALLRYADAAGTTLTVWRGPTRDPVPRELRCADVPGGLVAYTWSDGQRMHAVTAALPRDLLRPIALAVERDLKAPPPGAFLTSRARRPCDAALG
ncbi:anti-sigma factor [Falsiroseomonas bella]|uniref:Anti-sigma factor n=1 Tax=Falsiroseomonas bella TaxID=2184016 RepID=A0A317FID0_9PROT|nr:anti-sigma factor [Falsiroseomonas bella]PWS38854.1 anti-sigma factor [Falsiroseomonas bella]